LAYPRHKTVISQADEGTGSSRGRDDEHAYHVDRPDECHDRPSLDGWLDEAAVPAPAIAAQPGFTNAARDADGVKV
jgi:hypothetical protein